MIEWTWTNIALVLCGAWALVVLTRWHLDTKNQFDLRDLLADHNSNRASLDKLILAAFAALSIWVVVSWTIDGKNVETLLLGTLGIFVAKRAVDNFNQRDKP